MSLVVNSINIKHFFRYFIKNQARSTRLPGNGKQMYVSKKVVTTSIMHYPRSPGHIQQILGWIFGEKVKKQKRLTGLCAVLLKARKSKLTEIILLVCIHQFWRISSSLPISCDPIAEC